MLLCCYAVPPDPCFLITKFTLESEVVGFE